MKIDNKFLAFSILTVSLALAFSFIVTELSLRAYYYAQHVKLAHRHPEINSETLYMASSNPRLIYEFKKNFRGTNSAGYLDEEHSKIKRKGSIRIVVIGDSVAVGHHVKHELTFPKLLERKLINIYHRDVEVIVLARPGYNLIQELELLKLEAFTYSPDLIIWSYCLNDPANSLYHFGNSEMGRYFYHPRCYTWAFLKEKLFFLREWILGAGVSREYHQFLHALYHNEVADGIGQIGQLTKEHHVPVIFLINAVFSHQDTFVNYPYENIHVFLRNTAEKCSLNVVDSLDGFLPYKPSQVKNNDAKWFDPWHPNAKGHEIIANMLVERIKQSYSPIFY